MYILGKEVTNFEKEFAKYNSTKFAIGTGSGTEALHLALLLLGIGRGDAVITTSNTAVATIAAIELVGANPILVDINPDTFNIDPNCIEDHLKRLSEQKSVKVKAVIPVHLYGQPADMAAIMEIANRYELKVIEDCAQSCGAEIRKKKVGSWGHLAAFSFYPTKNLGALGDGGILITNDSKLAEDAYALREYGWKERYISNLPGINTRLDEIQAAILRIKLKYIDNDNSKRRNIAELYNAGLKHADVILPKVEKDYLHVYHQYVIRTSRRDQLQSYLKHEGIGTSVHYPLPVHFQPAYKNRRLVLGRLPITEAVVSEILSLPMFPELTESQVFKVTEKIKLWSF